MGSAVAVDHRTELTKVAWVYQTHVALTDREVSELSGIQPKNIPRSRVKLWYLGYLITDDFERFSISETGSQVEANDIKFHDDDYMKALHKFRKDRAVYDRGSNQQVLFDED